MIIVLCAIAGGQEGEIISSAGDGELVHQSLLEQIILHKLAKYLGVHLRQQEPADTFFRA